MLFPQAVTTTATTLQFVACSPNKGHHSLISCLWLAVFAAAVLAGSGVQEEGLRKGQGAASGSSRQ